MKKEYENFTISIKDINYVLSLPISSSILEYYENYEILNYNIDFRTKAEIRQEKINNLLKEI